MDEEAFRKQLFHPEVVAKLSGATEESRVLPQDIHRSLCFDFPVVSVRELHCLLDSLRSQDASIAKFLSVRSGGPSSLRGRGAAAADSKADSEGSAGMVSRSGTKALSELTALRPDRILPLTRPFVKGIASGLAASLESYPSEDRPASSGASRTPVGEGSGDSASFMASSDGVTLEVASLIGSREAPEKSVPAKDSSSGGKEGEAEKAFSSSVNPRAAELLLQRESSLFPPTSPAAVRDAYSHIAVVVFIRMLRHLLTLEPAEALQLLAFYELPPEYVAEPSADIEAVLSSSSPLSPEEEAAALEDRDAEEFDDDDFVFEPLEGPGGASTTPSLSASTVTSTSAPAGSAPTGEQGRATTNKAEVRAVTSLSDILRGGPRYDLSSVAVSPEDESTQRNQLLTKLKDLAGLGLVSEFYTETVWELSGSFPDVSSSTTSPQAPSLMTELLQLLECLVRVNDESGTYSFLVYPITYMVRDRLLALGGSGGSGGGGQEGGIHVGCPAPEREAEAVAVLGTLIETLDPEVNPFAMQARRGPVFSDLMLSVLAAVAAGSNGKGNGHSSRTVCAHLSYVWRHVAHLQRVSASGEGGPVIEAKLGSILHMARIVCDHGGSPAAEALVSSQVFVLLLLMFKAVLQPSSPSLAAVGASLLQRTLIGAVVKHEVLQRCVADDLVLRAAFIAVNDALGSNYGGAFPLVWLVVMATASAPSDRGDIGSLKERIDIRIAQLLDGVGARQSPSSPPPIAMDTEGRRRALREWTAVLDGLCWLALARGRDRVLKKSLTGSLGDSLALLRSWAGHESLTLAATAKGDELGSSIANEIQAEVGEAPDGDGGGTALGGESREGASREERARDESDKQSGYVRELGRALALLKTLLTDPDEDAKVD